MSDPEPQRTISNGQRPRNTLPHNASTNNETLQNVSFLDDEDPEDPNGTTISERQSKFALKRMPWISKSSRVGTDLNEVVVESRAFEHKHLVRRPRALQYIPSDAKDVQSRNSLVATPSQQASWENLRSYTSNYYVDDTLQRSFVVWILNLAVFIGINAPFAYNPEGEANSFTLCVAAYLITKASLIGAELF
ncbi:hypothetical protein B7494_g1070 [Chlorociboria aeruginascens]|nr:hypothetical protein B7494_g1070 [Chlorociboria aeruginascens]